MTSEQAEIKLDQQIKETYGSVNITEEVREQYKKNYHAYYRTKKKDD